jgi:hypothetical protein
MWAYQGCIRSSVFQVSYQGGHTEWAYQEGIPWGTPRGLFNVAYCRAYEGVMAMGHNERHTNRAYGRRHTKRAYHLCIQCCIFQGSFQGGIPMVHTMRVYQVMHSMFYTKASIPSGHTKRAYHGAYQEVYSVWHTVGHTKMDWPWGIPREAYQEGIPRGAFQEGIPCGHTKRCIQCGILNSIPSGDDQGAYRGRHTKRAYIVCI